MTPSTYQEGELILLKRKRLPHLWKFRYRRYMTDGTSSYVSVPLGTINEFPKERDIMPKVQEMRAKINSEAKGIFFRDIAKRYENDIIPQKRPHTQTTDLANLRHLTVKFGERRMVDITPGELDLFVNSVTSQGRLSTGGKRIGVGTPLSKTTRKHIKALAHHVWRQAMLWGFLNPSVNPVEITRVTQGARAKPRGVIVSIALYGKLLTDPELVPVVKVMVQVAMITGMRVSEILGLRWEDVDFKNGLLFVRRSVVGKSSNETKNVSSERDVPMPDDLAAALKEWKKAEQVWGGWLFGSPITERPYHSTGLQSDHLKPAGERAGVHGLGWHSFRHTVGSMMKQKGATKEERKALMGHATDQMAEHYGAHDPALLAMTRRAQLKVVKMLKTGTESK